jgi:hypothetical protein
MGRAVCVVQKGCGGCWECAMCVRERTSSSEWSRRRVAPGDVSTGSGTPLVMVATVPLFLGVPARKKKYRAP